MTADRSPLAAALAEALPTTIGAAFIRRKLGSPNPAFWERDANALLGHPAVVAALAQRDRDAVRALAAAAERERELVAALEGMCLQYPFAYLSDQEAACDALGHTVPADEWSREHFNPLGITQPCYCLSQQVALAAPDAAGPEAHPESPCQRCGRPNVRSWHAPSPLWNAVMRRDDGWDRFAVICPPCFAALADPIIGSDAGYVVWCFRPHDVTLPTDPAGRVWDAEQCLWVDASGPEAEA